jgi:hypothetical protein
MGQSRMIRKLEIPKPTASIAGHAATQLASNEDILCRYSACTCRIDVYGHHDGMEVCAAEIDCPAHQCCRSPYSRYPALCEAIPIRPLLREAQMTQSSFGNVLEYANRESKCLTMIHATSARRG